MTQLCPWREDERGERVRVPTSVRKKIKKEDKQKKCVASHPFRFRRCATLAAAIWPPDRRIVEISVRHCDSRIADVDAVEIPRRPLERNNLNKKKNWARGFPLAHSDARRNGVFSLRSSAQNIFKKKKLNETKLRNAPHSTPLRVNTTAFLVAPSFNEFYRVLPGFTGFYLVLPSLTGFDWLSSYLVSMIVIYSYEAFLDFISYYRVFT